MKTKIFKIYRLFSFAFFLGVLVSCKNPLFIDAVKLYEVSFETNGGTALNTIRTDFIEKTPQTEKEDCIFEGWYTSTTFSGKAIQFPFEPTNDTTLYAKWNQTVFSTSFVTNCDTSIDSYKTDCIKTAPVLTKTDYVFVDWFTTADFKGTPITFPYTLTENTTLYAKWARSVFTVNFETNCDEKIASYKTDAIETAPTISKTDYVLDGWYTTEDFSDIPISFPYTLTADTTLYAKWVQNVFNATFVTNCDTKISSYKTDIIEKAPDASKNNYILVGWFTSADFTGTPVTFPYILTADTTLYAKWAQTVFTVNFVTNCEKVIASYKTDKILNSPVIEREGYALEGWYTTANFSGSKVSFPFTLTKDVTLYAKWIIKQKPESITVTSLVDDSDSVSISATTNDASVVFTATEGFNSYRWIIDEEVQEESSHILTTNYLSHGYHTITVLVKKQDGVIVSSTCTVRVTQGSSNSRLEEINADEKQTSKANVLNLNNDSNEILIDVSYSSNIVNFTATSGYSSYMWILDDEILESTTNAISLTDLPKGYHLVTVSAQNSDGATVSNYIRIRTTE